MLGRRKKTAGRQESDAWILTFPEQLVADIEADLKPLVTEALASAPRVLVADLSAVTLSNTAGLGTLVTLVHRARSAGVPVVFAGASGRTRVLLDRLGLPRHAALADSVEAALRGGAT